MNVQDFWSIVENARRAAGPGASATQLEGALTATLASMRAGELLEFEVRFETLHRALYTWDLWSAATIIRGGCSDDGFTDFRTWVISAGREIYEVARVNPDGLAGIDLDISQIDATESYAYVAGDLYEALAGESIGLAAAEQLSKLPRIESPAGDRWTSADLPARLPALSARFAPHR